MARFARSPAALQNDRVDVVYSRTLFSAEECESIIDWSEQSVWEGSVLEAGDGQAMEAGHVTIDPSTRDREIGWLPRKLKGIVGDLNRQIWRFDITRLGKIFVIRYHQADGAKLHTDLENNKKLGVVLQLSPTDAYEGGTLELGLVSPFAASRERGSVLVFPTWIPHRVTPITSGTRYVVATFATGPSFR